MAETSIRGRKGKYPEEDVKKALDEYWAGPCDMIQSRVSYVDIASFMNDRGMPMDSNYVRHNRLIKEYMDQLYQGNAGLGLENDGQVSLLDEISELKGQVKRCQDFIRDHFIEGVCNHLIAASGEGLHPRELLKPESAEKAVITPSDDVWESEMVKDLMDIFNGGTKNGTKD